MYSDCSFGEDVIPYLAGHNVSNSTGINSTNIQNDSGKQIWTAPIVHNQLRIILVNLMVE